MEQTTAKLIDNVVQWRQKTTKQKTIQPLFSHKDYNLHANTIKEIGDTLLLNEGKQFTIDEDNEKVLRFLLLYFNNMKECEKIFPNDNHSLKKNILLMGPPGTGKTLIMQIFHEYLKRSQSELIFRNIGATELLNYQKINGHINLFTYNFRDSTSFEGKPQHICLNDLGISSENQKSFGTDLGTIIDEFLYARYEIWTNKGKRYHITTNMDANDFMKAYDKRLVDRMKAFNLLTLKGKSRR